MPTPSSGEITQLLLRAREGDNAAEQQLIDLVYPDLRRLAYGCMRGERADHTLQPTALLHDAWLQLIRGQEIDWQNRTHFFALAARQMRRILVDYARARGSQKRGGEWHRVEVEDCLSLTEDRLEAVLLVHDALDQLVEWDPRQAQIVELRYFGGLTEDEIAAALGISPRTVKRDWNMARGWLAARMQSQA